MTAPLPNLSVDVKLAQVIASIESSNNPHCIRFEPRIYKELDASGALASTLESAISKANACSDDGSTAHMIASTSWGAYQIMGENLYSLGYGKSVADFLNSAADQLEYFARFLASRKMELATLKMLVDSVTARTAFAVKYNGSSKYADVILGRAHALGLV